MKSLKTSFYDVITSVLYSEKMAKLFAVEELVLMHTVDHLPLLRGKCCGRVILPAVLRIHWKGTKFPSCQFVKVCKQLLFCGIA